MAKSSFGTNFADKLKEDVLEKAKEVMTKDESQKEQGRQATPTRDHQSYPSESQQVVDVPKKYLSTIDRMIEGGIDAYAKANALSSRDEAYSKFYNFYKNDVHAMHKKYAREDNDLASSLQNNLAHQARGGYGGRQASKKDENYAVNNVDTQEKEVELAQEKEEKDEAIQKANQELQEQIAELKAQEQAELAKEDGERSLPPLVALFANPLFLIGMMIIDSLVAVIPVAGDFIGLVISAAVWAIPCIIMFSMKAYVNIWKFFLFDLIFGLVVGTLGNVVPGVGDMLLDAIPEAILLIAMLFGSNKK